MTTDPPDTLDTSPSQVRRPWRATIRTVLTAALALIPILPSMAQAADIDEIPTIAAVLATAAGITRVLALPAVDQWLDKFIPWLSADPYEGKHRKDHP